MFVTFEGLDGAGKSTQIDRLVQKLKEQGMKVLVTREPGGTSGGQQIREWLLNPDADWTPIAEAYLYAASRAQLVETVIRPALQKGEIVICDRYVDASIAYQGAGLGLGERRVAVLNELAVQDVRPDLTFLFDLPVTDSRHRIVQGREGQQLDRIEKRTTEYFERVRRSFLAIAAAEPHRVVILDARQNRETLEQEIWLTIEKYLT
ncbi:dTMP kinase [Alicyclobacillus tolerans]|uniref:Thymidylate kinase n=1 Tax=Alicyclobacillus tolerans TaxID=90970 RepID=A0ABT9LYR8_9BACL|nr:dTMP kinase [Alicyclobacillus tengchongensis]MDP9729291.1 dTMP kinase [Alicyclobacillus tengchongensis]